MVHLFKKFIELGLKFFGLSTVWEDNSDCSKKYGCAISISIITVLLSLYGIIIYSAINAPNHVSHVDNGINDNDRCYLKEQIELISKFINKDTPKTIMLPSALKYHSVSFSEQSLNIITNKHWLNLLEGNTIIKTR